MLQTGRLFLLGALSFWGPELLLYAIRRKDLPSLVTFLLPGCLVLGYFLAVRLRWCKGAGQPSGAIFMLLGVWVFGPTAMVLGATFRGAGFLALNAHEALMATLGGLFPPFSFIMATYDGSLFALLLAWALMPIFHFVFELKGWILPPSWRAHLRFRKKPA